MARDPEVRRVVAELKRTAEKARKAEVRAAVKNNAAGNAWTVADNASKAAFVAWDAAKNSPSAWDATSAALDAANDAERVANDLAQRTHYEWGEVDGRAYAAEDDLAVARGCQTLKDLVSCDHRRVREAALFALNPAPPAPKRKR